MKRTKPMNDPRNDEPRKRDRPRAAKGRRALLLALGAFAAMAVAIGVMAAVSTSIAQEPKENAGLAPAAPAGKEGVSVTDKPTRNTDNPTNNTEKPTTPTSEAIFAAGCFWGVEAAFRQVPGVVSTEVGYTGGHFPDPTYQDVCSDKTGHAEAVRVVYDPKRAAYDDLLKVFWENHDPTTPNRQGPDVGSQYRSAIFYRDDEQKRAALASKDSLEESHTFKRPIVTEIVAASTFYRAEEYHQQYLEKRGLSQCHIPVSSEQSAVNSEQ